MSSFSIHIHYLTTHKLLKWEPVFRYLVYKSSQFYWEHEKQTNNKKLARFWEDTACFSLHLGVLFYVTSFEVSGALCRTAVQTAHQPLYMKVWTAITINHSQCGWGNIGLIHSVVALQIPLSVRALFDWSKQERFESWHTRAHSAEHPVMRGGTVLGRHCSSEPAHWGRFSHILSICNESVFKSPNWLFYRLEGCINILCVYAHTEFRVNYNHRKVARPSNMGRGLIANFTYEEGAWVKSRVCHRNNRRSICTDSGLET